MRAATIRQLIDDDPRLHHARSLEGGLDALRIAIIASALARTDPLMLARSDPSVAGAAT